MRVTFLRRGGVIAFALTIAPVCTTLAHGQTSPVTAYSEVWKPVDDVQTRRLVRQNATNGLGLGKLWWRANLYSQAWAYLSELQNIMKQQPGNAVAPAAYALGLVKWRHAQYTGRLSQEVASKVDLSEPHILSLLDRSKKVNSRSWLAYVADSSFSPRQMGSWPPSKDEVASAKRAYSIQENPLTALTLAQALQSQAYNLQKSQYGVQSVTLLQRAHVRFPNYPPIDAALFQYYTYYPYTKNLEAGKQAEQRLINSIPPSLRQTQPIKLYLESLHLK